MRLLRPARLGASTSLRGVALLTLAAMLPVGLLAVSSIELASQAVRRGVEQRMQSTAAVSAVFAEQTTDGLAALVQSYATRRALVSDVRAGAAGDAEVLAQLGRLAASSFSLRGAFITDLSGTLTDVHPPTPGIVGRNFAFRDWYQGLEAGGGPYVSTAYQSALAGEPLVVAVVDYVRVPGGAPVAIIAAIFDLEAIQTFGDEISDAQGIDLTITDRNGIVLSEGRDQGLLSIREDPRVVRAAAGDSGSMEHTPAPVGGEAGVKELSAYAPVDKTGWTVTASVPHREAMASLARMRETVLTVTAVLVLMLLAGAVVTARALRRRHEVEDQVRRQEKELTRVVDSTDEAFVSIDGEGLITAWSRRAEALFGWPAAMVIGSPLAQTIIPPAQRSAHLRAIARSDVGSTSKVVGRRIELTALHRDGHELPVELGVWAHEDGAGFSGFVHDISDRVTFQAELEAARDASMQASRHKSEFLATMSHEIRTPMNAVIGMTGLLLDTTLDEEQREFTETVRDSGEALLAVINDILDFSKIEAGEVDLEVHPFELRECVESALALVAFTAGAKGLELVADLDEHCPELVTGDVTRFRQVMVNLLSNAVKFTERGEVVVTVRSERLDDARDGAVRLTVGVRDTGVGIPADRTDRLFRPFSQVDSSTTRTHGGTGLGLVISRRLAEAMGGSLVVESEVGVGSTFTFDAVLATSSDRRLPTTAGAGELAGTTVLIVDDNATNRRVLEVVLSSWGMSCTQVATPAAALALLAAGRQFDVAVLDMHMPEMDGQQLARAMRGLPTGRDVPLILLTSLQSRPALADRSLFAATLTKPARSSVLCERLLEVLVPSRAAMLAVETAGGTRAGDGPAVASTLRVLLAEDNPVNQKVAQLVLAKLGYRVDSVSNGLEALLAVRSGGYDVVLMDVQMPVLDGIEATRAIRAEVAPDHQPHIIAMTASALIEDEAACREAGMDSYLTKPIRPHELGEALARVVRPPAGASRPDH